MKQQEPLHFSPAERIIGEAAWAWAPWAGCPAAGSSGQWLLAHQHYYYFLEGRTLQLSLPPYSDSRDLGSANFPPESKALIFSGSQGPAKSLYSRSFEWPARDHPIPVCALGSGWVACPYITKIPGLCRKGRKSGKENSSRSQSCLVKCLLTKFLLRNLWLIHLWLHANLLLGLKYLSIYHLSIHISMYLSSI